MDNGDKQWDIKNVVDAKVNHVYKTREDTMLVETSQEIGNYVTFLTTLECGGE